MSTFRFTASPPPDSDFETTFDSGSQATRHGRLLRAFMETAAARLPTINDDGDMEVELQSLYELREALEMVGQSFQSVMDYTLRAERDSQDSR